MNILFGIFGVIGSVVMLKYREKLGDIMGDPDWMRYVGGVYNFIVLLAIFLFFWSIAVMTGTTSVLFKPLLLLFPNPNPTITPGVVQ
jgi:hypothetical protein